MHMLDGTGKQSFFYKNLVQVQAGNPYFCIKMAELFFRQMAPTRFKAFR